MKTREELYKEWLKNRAIKGKRIEQLIAWAEKEIKEWQEFIKILKK